MEASRALPPAAAQDAQSRSLLHTADHAFEQLYRRHAAEIYRYALAVLGNPADAEDVTQTTFLNAYRAFRRGQRPLQPHNWLVAIAHNVCRMRWRQAGHRPREVALENAPETAAPESERPDLDEVLRALGRLSFNQRAALVMRELEDRSCKEIAEVLGLSTGAVEALLFRARKRLRLERRALGALSTAPLPGQLASYLGGLGTGGTVAAGGAGLGVNLLLKAAVVLALGAATAGTVAVARPVPAQHGAATPVIAVSPSSTHLVAATRARARHRGQTKRTKSQRAIRTHRTQQGSAAQTVVGTGTSTTAGAAPPPSAAPAPPPVQVPQLPVAPPALPPLPPVPPLPPLPPPPVLPPPPLP